MSIERELAAAAAHRFFIRVGQKDAKKTRRCEQTLPLFSLALILAADGTLAASAAHLLDRKSGKQSAREEPESKVLGRGIGITCRHEFAVHASVRAAFVPCACGGTAMFLYRGSTPPKQ